jgi:pimeloyl-ACP methyl ester carboxylesterase
VLERIDVPTLLVWGGASNFYGLATAQYVHEHIRGSTLHVYEDTDHSPHQWQRERFERDLLSFVAR